MDNNTTQDFDLSKKWTKVLRDATKTTNSYSCWICPDKRTFGSEDDTWRHFRHYHPAETSGETEIAKQTFSEVLKIQAASQDSKSRDAAPGNKHAYATRRTKPPSNLGSPRSSQQPPATTALTVSKLEAFQQTQPTEDRPRKKAAIGSGPSPSSSIRTDTSSRGGNEASPSRRSLSNVTPSLQDSFDRRGDSRGPNKRLYEPHNEVLSTGRNQSSNLPPRPRSSALQYHQHKLSPGSIGKPQQIQPFKSDSKPIPIGILKVPPQIPQTQQDEPTSSDPEEFRIVRQPETRPISQEQLVAEVKGIYAGLVMVEGKCIQVDQKQVALARDAEPGTQLKLSNEQWQALIALHRTLLHEHHDFFLASQHPSATLAVRRLAIKYAMPARLWRHGIHSFLELLRNRLPDSLDHMLAFIYLAYSMMTLLYETVPAFEETWIECLGDLGRYRMAIEDDDLRDREVWTQVARQWYLKASDKQPATGRLYHHLAILARPNALQQLFFYGKALSVSQPFIAARESVLSLFEPVLNQKQAKRFPPVISAFVKVNAIIFLHTSRDDFGPVCEEFTSLLDSHIARVTQRFLEQGYYLAISNTIALLSFGSSDSILVKALSTQDASDIAMGGTIEDPLMLKEAQQLLNQTTEIILQRVGDPNILSYLHVVMVFMTYMSGSLAAMALLENGFPMGTLVTMLNTLIRFYTTFDRIEQEARPVPEKNDFRPSPEEFAMRGLFWALKYFPAGWFTNSNIEDENQFKEEASMCSEYRPEMILWLAVKFARSGDWIRYNEQEKRFFIPVKSPTETSEKEVRSRSTSVTVIGEHDEVVVQDEEMSFASQTSQTSQASSRKTTWESGNADADSNWDAKTDDSQVTSKDHHMGAEEEVFYTPMETVDSPQLFQ